MSILATFAGQTDWAYYDASDWNTLFQDAARTQPVTALGQRIGGVTDKSGNGFHLKFTNLDGGNGERRPYLAQDANGRNVIRIENGQSLRTEDGALNFPTLSVCHYAIATGWRSYATLFGIPSWTSQHAANYFQIFLGSHFDNLSAATRLTHSGGTSPLGPYSNIFSTTEARVYELHSVNHHLVVDRVTRATNTTRLINYPRPVPFVIGGNGANQEVMPQDFYGTVVLGRNMTEAERDSVYTDLVAAPSTGPATGEGATVSADQIANGSAAINGVTSPSYDAVVIIGASHEAGMFGKNLSTPHAIATNLLAQAGHNLPVYGYATGGAVLTDAPSHYNAARAAFPNALIISQFGGNNVSQNRPYPGGTSIIQSGLAGLLAVSAGDQRFQPLALTFRDYDDLTFQDPSRGSKPYNENIFIPWIAANFPHALTSYGRPKIDYYRKTLENYDTWLTADNVHYTPEFGEPAFRAWIIQRVADILSGVEPAEIAERVYQAPVEPEPSIYPLSIINFTGEAFAAEFKAPPNDVIVNATTVDPNPLPDIKDVSGASTGMALSMSYTGNPASGATVPGRGANSDGNRGSLPAFSGQLMSANVVGASAYVTQQVTLVLGLSGLVPGAEYEIGMVGSRNTTETRNTDVTVAGITTTWNTSEATPQARYVTVAADAGGNIPIVMKPNGSTSFGYLGGLSVQRLNSAATVTGDGATVSADQTAAGVAVRSVTASGASVAGDQLAAGAVKKARSASGATTAKKQTAVGAAKKTRKGVGATASADQTAAGVSVRSVVAVGATGAADQTAAGAAQRAVAGAGGSVTADQTAAGAGVRLVAAAGASVAADQTANGTAGNGTARAASGASIAPRQTATGAALRVVAGAGASVAADQLAAGAVKRTRKGAGGSVAADQTAAGTVKRTVKGVGASVAADQTAAGISTRAVVCYGSSVASPQFGFGYTSVPSLIDPERSLMVPAEYRFASVANENRTVEVTTSNRSV